MDKDIKPKKRNIVGVIVGMISFALASYGAKQLFKKDFESELKQAVIELNNQSPMQIDQFSRLDSASTTGNKNFTYHYTLFDLEKAEVNLDTVNKYIRPTIIENIKTNPELKIFRDNNVTMDYEYYDKHGNFITEISVTPEIYND